MCQHALLYVWPSAFCAHTQPHAFLRVGGRGHAHAKFGQAGLSADLCPGPFVS